MAKPNLNHSIREALRDSVMKMKKHPAPKKSQSPVSGGPKALDNRNSTDNRDTNGGTD